MLSVATAIVEGRRRSWTGGKACPLDPFDTTDEPSGCSPSQAAIRRTMIVFNHQFGKFSHSCCVDSQTSVKRQASRQRKEPLLTEIDVNACKVRPTPAVIPLCLTVMDGFPDKYFVVAVIISYEKASQVFEEKELDKHRLLAQWGVVVVVREWSRRLALHEWWVLALKFALKGSKSFKACFELYRCLNPEKSSKWSCKNDFWVFLHDFCSMMFWVVAWVEVEFRVYLVSDVVCCLIDCYYSCCCPCLPSWETVYRVDGFLAKRCFFFFFAMADYISAKSHTLNRALKCYKSFKTEL